MKPPMETLDRLDESIKKLRIAYEKYFAGVERVAPERERDLLKKDLNRLLSHRINNTAWKFRLHGLQTTMITHETYWNRITRQIEEGTYRRDLARLERKQASARPPSPQEEEKPAAAPAATHESATATHESATATHESATATHESATATHESATATHES
ncbi:MAG: hypothetical protein V3T05_07430, partial [Myxococcota bacterium]